MGVPDRLALNLFLASFSALATGQAQSESLEWMASPDSAVQEEIAVDWEKEWTEWCETAHCVSSDTSLWNIEGEGLHRIGHQLDSTFVATRLAALDRVSGLDLRWNPVAHRRIVTFGTRRSRHLGTMLGRSAMYFPLFEKVLDRDCLLYTSPSPRDRTRSRMPSSA